jgi:putative peptide zinc metalloprotease protein
VRAGESVEAGQTLARLENLDLRREIAELTGLRDLQRLRLANLKRRRVGDPSLGEQIPVAEEALADLEKRLQQRLLDSQRLTLSAPAAGTVLPPPQRNEQHGEGELRFWAGAPLDERNRGARLETGALVCLIGNPRQLEAVLVIDQADIEFVRAGQRARILLPQLPGRVLGGVVEEIAEIDLQAAPAALVCAGYLPALEDQRSVRRPLSTCYLARVLPDAHDHPLLIGACGRAKIRVAPRSIGWRIRRYLSRTFRFSLSPWSQPRSTDAASD